MSRWLWLWFAVFIVYGTTIPFEFAADRAAVRTRIEALSWNPLTRPDGRRVSIPDTVQNVMLFLPFGALGVLAAAPRRALNLRRILWVTALAGGLSLTVEALQLLTVDRVASISDVVANTIGGCVGAIVTERGRSRLRRALSRIGHAPAMASAATYPVMVAGAVLLISAWQPFDVTLDVSGVAGKVRGLLSDPWQFGPLTDEGSAFMLYALTTAALAHWLRDARVGRPGFTAGVTLTAVALALELSQIFISSRTPSGWDAGIRVSGVVCAALVAPIPGDRYRALPWMGVLVALTVVAASIELLSPFQVVDIRQPFSWFPFLGYYRTNWFPALSHLIEVLLVYVPLGFCAGLRDGRSSTVWRVTTGALVLGLLIEYLQSWVIGRYADVTDVACSGLGAALGVWLATRGAAAFERARTAPELC